MSLRWISDISSLDFKRAILEDFDNYHFILQKKNNLINTKIGDHTTSFRLNVVRNILRDFERKLAENDAAISLCRKLMTKDVQALLSPDIYRDGHNHGLMADVAILNAIKDLNDSKLDLHIEHVVKRGMATLRNMYTTNSITKEHSISYQEYNYPIAVDFLKSCEMVGIDAGQLVGSNLTKSTRELLYFFTRKNGEFFPLGDSFRIPNQLIRKAHPELNPDDELIRNTGTSGHRIFCVDGFFSYIRQTDESRLHFVATCNWHSGNHKQDDDLSFCLEIDGTLIFDDSGYTDFSSRTVANTLRESSQHSSIRIEGRPFLPRNPSNGQSKIQHWSEDTNGFSLSATHERIEGIQVRRTFVLSRNHLDLFDEIDLLRAPDEQLCSFHDFIFAPDINAKPEGPVLHITKRGQRLGILIAHAHDGEWQQQEVAYIPAKRSELSKTTRYSYYAPLRAHRAFSFIYYSI